MHPQLYALALGTLKTSNHHQPISQEKWYAKSESGGWDVSWPIGSMYAIYGNIYHQYTPNVSIYTIHGSYGWCFYPRKVKNGEAKRPMSLEPQSLTPGDPRRLVPKIPLRCWSETPGKGSLRCTWLPKSQSGLHYIYIYKIEWHMNCA